MTETETFYRLHGTWAPAFSADNAYSALWGVTFSEDGARYACVPCDGTTKDPWGHRCEWCEDTEDGWYDADRGYSACDSAEELVRYFGQHAEYLSDDEPVVEFTGDVVGTGCDGEPLIVPTAVVRWTTLGQLRAELAQ